MKTINKLIKNIIDQFTKTDSTLDNEFDAISNEDGSFFGGSHKRQVISE